MVDTKRNPGSEQVDRLTCACGQPMFGVEVRGVYDGVLFWQCPAGHRQHRFRFGTELHTRAQSYVDAETARG